MTGSLLRARRLLGQRWWARLLRPANEPDELWGTRSSAPREPPYSPKMEKQKAKSIS